MNKPQILSGKRFLFVLPQLELGGTELQALHFARYLKSIGCDVRFWGHHAPGLVVDLCNKAGIPRAIYPFRWPCWKRSLMRVGWGILRFLRTLRRERPDVIFAYMHLGNVACGLTWRITGARAVMWNRWDLNGKGLKGRNFERLAARLSSGFIEKNTHYHFNKT